ncbi:solute carrier family 25 member 40 [Plakobranchus ocellatus]|uniref:Solute carrier family 25 member 40 n=1 Tax=Plakobranchus ocellatus TaxID=259542 RepID=A0AAV3XYT6_9GAST|nr:solute carrier family 25 member 40 [Plakobranchus ocellatus]
MHHIGKMKNKKFPLEILKVRKHYTVQTQKGYKEKQHLMMLRSSHQANECDDKEDDTASNETPNESQTCHHCRCSAIRSNTD